MAAVVAGVAEAAEVAVAAAVVVVAVAVVAALRGELAAFAKADHSSIALTNEVSGRVRQRRPGRSMWCQPHVIFASPAIRSRCLLHAFFTSNILYPNRCCLRCRRLAAATRR